MDMSAFMDEFRAEAEEHLRTLDEQLLKLERDPADPEPVRKMFRSAHTIKGSAAMVGLEEIRGLAHAMEDVLGKMRDQKHALDGSTADLLFRALDALKELVGGGPANTNVEELQTALRRRASAPVSASVAEAATRPAAKPLVLLVEDSPTVRYMEKAAMIEAGFNVEAVGDGKEALTIALAKRCQLVVAGMETKGLRGPELIACLRESAAYSNVPAILLGSEDDAEHRGEAATAGAQAYLRRGTAGHQELVATALDLVGQK